MNCLPEADFGLDKLFSFTVLWSVQQPFVYSINLKRLTIVAIMNSLIKKKITASFSMTYIRYVKYPFSCLVSCYKNMTSEGLSIVRT